LLLNVFVDTPSLRFLIDFRRNTKQDRACITDRLSLLWSPESFRWKGN
jgi:hypothetical protein